jgi:hypothetical protein
MLQLQASSTTGFAKEIAAGGRPTSEVNVSEMKASGPCVECQEETSQRCDCCLLWICDEHAIGYSIFMVGEPFSLYYCQECEVDVIQRRRTSEANGAEDGAK